MTVKQILAHNLQNLKIKIQLFILISFSYVCSSNGKYFTEMLHELLNMAIVKSETFPLSSITAFVLILAKVANESALFTKIVY